MLRRLPHPTGRRAAPADRLGLDRAIGGRVAGATDRHRFSFRPSDQITSIASSSTVGVTLLRALRAASLHATETGVLRHVCPIAGRRRRRGDERRSLRIASRPTRQSARGGTASANPGDRKKAATRSTPPGTPASCGNARRGGRAGGYPFGGDDNPDRPRRHGIKSVCNAASRAAISIAERHHLDDGQTNRGNRQPQRSRGRHKIFSQPVRAQAQRRRQPGSAGDANLGA